MHSDHPSFIATVYGTVVALDPVHQIKPLAIGQ